MAFEDIKGFAFDMDGVLADTAKFHSIAWRQIAEEVGTAWTPGLAENLKGIDRMGSLDLILTTGGFSDDYDLVAREALATKKNDNYRELISTLTPKDALPGMHEFLAELKSAGYKMSIASASKNAGFIVERLGILDFFESIVDPASVSAGKPDPAIFAEAAKVLNLQPNQVVGLEDSGAGLQSINGAGQTSIGIGDATALAAADILFKDTSEVTLANIQANWPNSD